MADIPALENLLARAWTLARTLPDALVSRFEQAVVAISATEREATVRQRVGQSLFRDGLMALWGGRCAVTGLDVPELLRASHAKPWADCNDRERLDVYNGFLLSAHWDAAFDAGLVTVSPDGVMLASPALPDSARIVAEDFLRGAAPDFAAATCDLHGLAPGAGVSICVASGTNWPS